jgi:hypothetical protein
MARIQVLHLPGGTDDAPLFAIVVDGMDSVTHEKAAFIEAGLSRFCGQIGAKGLVLLPGSVAVAYGPEDEPQPAGPDLSFVETNEFWNRFNRARRMRESSFP